MAAEFAVGQRWLSESETELGLGIITQVEGRQLTVLFPATEEIRYYAVHSAPLVRYQLQTDERGQHADGWHFSVIDSQENNGVLTYQVHPEASADGPAADASVKVPETQLAHHIAAGQPLTRLMAGKTDRLDLFQLRQQAQGYIQHVQQSPVAGFFGARISLLPHQLYVAHSVADRYYPRVLLSDEVGLGKTIEAGLILQRRLLTGRARRALIVVPESLIHQWLVELKRRFALTFSLFDEERCEQAALDHEAVFDSEQLVIIGTEMLSHPRWAAALTASHWDIMVVDEAHHLAEGTAAFATIEQLSLNSKSLLLLTATPEQLGAEHHFSRLRLLDPNRFFDYDEFVKEQAGYQPLAEQADYLATDKALPAAVQQQLQERLGEVVSANPDSDERQRLLDKLLDHYGTGRVMFRNSRQHVGGFPQRLLHPHELPAATAKDPRFEWLLGFLKSNRPERCILICESADTVLDLAEALRVKSGIHAAVFHEHMTLAERDRAAAFFASEEEASPILLCSEIGSEGRNFQFVQHLILFDLPAHPDLLEQRIGRLDRIGQANDVHIHVPICADSVTAIRFAWFNEGMQAFTQCNNVGHALWTEFADQLQDVIDCHGDGLDELIVATADRADELRAELTSGRDRLQELNACRPQQAAAVLERIEADEKSAALAEFAMAFCDRFGIDVEQLAEQRWFVRPSDHMRVAALPGLDDEGMQITFDRATAMHREDVELLSWDHPFVRSMLDLLHHEHFGSTCVAVLNNNALPAGSWFIELYFTSSVLAPPALVADEFYPLQRFRVLLDSQGRDLTAKVPAAALDKQCHFVDKKAARQLLKQLRSQCQQLVNAAWTHAETAQQSAIVAAEAMVTKQLTDQLARLEQLQQRNPNVRPAELAALQARRQDLQKSMQQPQLKLDSLRLIVNAPA